MLLGDFEPTWPEVPPKEVVIIQEDIERRTIAISVTATKLTAKTLAKAQAAALRKLQQAYHDGQTRQGKQRVKKLMQHGVSTNSLPLDGETRLFDRVARKWNVDYAFHKTGPNKYLLFFKAGQADAITACFSEYTKLVMDRAKNKRPSIIEQLKHFGERARSNPPREHEKGSARILSDSDKPKQVLSKQSNTAL